jgi:hypothetical protein
LEMAGGAGASPQQLCWSCLSPNHLKAKCPNRLASALNKFDHARQVGVGSRGRVWRGGRGTRRSGRGRWGGRTRGIAGRSTTSNSMGANGHYPHPSSSTSLDHLQLCSHEDDEAVEANFGL